MTDARPTASESAVLREVVRRAGHEIRNSLSGVAVNLEVVRSRCSRDPSPSEIVQFADRARLEIAQATTLTNGLLAVVNAALATGADGKAKSAGGNSGPPRLALKGDVSAVIADIELLGRAIGVSVERRGVNVILMVLPEGRSHSKD